MCDIDMSCWQWVVNSGLCFRACYHWDIYWCCVQHLVAQLSSPPPLPTVSALTLLVGQQEGHPVCKNTGCWFVDGGRFDWSFARLIAPVVTTTSIILSSSKMQNGDVLVLANPDPSGKWPLKLQRKFRVNISKIQIKNAHWTKLHMA